MRIQLLRQIQDKTIKRVTVNNQKTVMGDRHFAERLAGLRFRDIDRIGKMMIFSFAGKKDLFLLAHLKMTGQFLVTDKKGSVVGGGGHSEADALGPLPNRHTRVMFELQGGTTLFFNDQRIFGYLRLVDRAGLELAKARFGPEPIKSDFDKERFISGLKRKSGPIKAVLLDQTFIAGLGNIYVDEALFRSRVLPERPANTLTRSEALLLIKHSGAVMNESIALGGTTFQHFIDATGAKGSFKEKLRVFGRQGEKCVRCRNIIVKSRVAGRGTHYCEVCQK